MPPCGLWETITYRQILLNGLHGVGVSPLLQWIVVPALGFGCVRRWLQGSER